MADEKASSRPRETGHGDRTSAPEQREPLDRYWIDEELLRLDGISEEQARRQQSRHWVLKLFGR